MSYSRLLAPLIFMALLNTAGAAATMTRHMLPSTRQADLFTGSGVYRSLDGELNIVKHGNSIHFALFDKRRINGNRGFIGGEIASDATSWSMRKRQCHLHFSAVTGGIHIDQDHGYGDCGFGYGVRADGSYYRVPGAKPSLANPIVDY